MILYFFSVLLMLNLFAADPVEKPIDCKSLHTGTFKLTTKETGTTFIERTEKFQTEINEQLGVEIIFDITWTNECTYELRPKKLVRGDPAMMGDGTYVLKTRIKKITTKSYIAETTANFNPGTHDFVVEIIK